jgi:hypothetical protein
MNEKQKILQAYEEMITEAPLSDKHGMVMSSTAETVLLIKKINNMMKKQEPHWPDVVMNLKKAQAQLQKAQKAAK